MANLRKLARGRDCQIRIPGICNGNPDTVVLCHIPGGGMGGKQPDMLGAWGCSSCHNVVDGRSNTTYPRELLMLWLLEGMVRTQQILLDEGAIHA